MCIFSLKRTVLENVSLIYWTMCEFIQFSRLRQDLFSLDLILSNKIRFVWYRRYQQYQLSGLLPLTWVEIFWWTYLQNYLQTSPPAPQKLYPNFQHFLKIIQFSAQTFNILGPRGSPKIFSFLKSKYFCYLGAHMKFGNLHDEPFCFSVLLDF